MRFSLFVIASALLFLLVDAKDELRIGILHRPAECGRKSKKGDKLKMHYTGTLLSDGSKFDSSHDRGEAFEFVLGKGQVIKGWDQGLVGMCKGEKRKLKIPPHLAYGERGQGKIPPASWLQFEVECVDVSDDATAQFRPPTPGDQQ